MPDRDDEMTRAASLADLHKGEQVCDSKKGTLMMLAHSKTRRDIYLLTLSNDQNMSQPGPEHSSEQIIHSAVSSKI